MNIQTFGGEFKVIENVVKKVKNKKVIRDAGDDAAVIDIGNSKTYQLVSSEMYTDGNHFSLRYFTPLDIGAKVAEATFSDIGAMGGKPKYFFLCYSIKKNMEMSFVRSFFRGIYSSCSHHGVHLLGGDTVSNNKMFISATVIGEVEKSKLCLRKGAKEGDVIKVSGELGSSNIGFQILRKDYVGHSFVKKKHTHPRCRLDIVDKIAPHATSMIDISDGLAGDLSHICKQSGVGAEINERDIPVHTQAIHAAKALKLNIYHSALYGGEDFELLYTVNPKDVAKTPGKVVGRITRGQEVILIRRENGKRDVVTGKGYRHF